MSDLFKTGVRPLVDQFLLDEAAKVRDYGSYWSASSAGYCQRKVIFERLGVPSVQKDARKQRVFSAGHIFHKWIQGLTKKAGISIAQEVELQDEDLMVRGHFDDLVLVKSVEELNEDPTGGTGKYVSNLILYDYKTVNSQSFKYKKDKMSQYHRLQLGTYMYMLRKRVVIASGDANFYETKDLTEARILNISKDDLRMSETQLMWDAQLESEVLNYWKTLNTHWSNKTLPRCTCADHEGGFMAREKWNPYFYGGEPCSLAYYNLFKEGKLASQKEET